MSNQNTYLNNGEFEEKDVKAGNGMTALIVITLLLLAATALFIVGAVILDDGGANTKDILLARAASHKSVGAVIFACGLIYLCIGWIPYLGLKVIKPNEALVLTLFGKYCGTLKLDGFYFVNPFCVAINPAAGESRASSATLEQPKNIPAFSSLRSQNQFMSLINKKVSMKVTTLNNDKQKINDQLGNPIIIGIAVVWKVINPTKAVFNVDDYKEYLSIQCDSALRNIARLYPYDTFGDDNEKTLRGSSQEIAINLKDEIQQKVEMAGIQILEARITSLSYAPEIAAAMLQRQQASAIIDARQMIVEGAVGMVEMALAKLNAREIVNLDDERKAAMVSNLMVVLCSNRDTQPVINSGTLY